MALMEYATNVKMDSRSMQIGLTVDNVHQDGLVLMECAFSAKKEHLRPRIERCARCVRHKWLVKMECVPCVRVALNQVSLVPNVFLVRMVLQELMDCVVPAHQDTSQVKTECCVKNVCQDL